MLGESNFENLLQITNPKILSKIKTNFRLKYLRDCVIASYAEDFTLQIISSIIVFNNSEILNFFMMNDDLIFDFWQNLGNENLIKSIKFQEEILELIKGSLQVLSQFNIARYKNQIH